MARVPVLERAFGQDRLAAIHRLVGFTSFNLMLAHVVADHLGVRRRQPGRDARRPCGTSPGPTPGCCSPWPGTVCLVMVVVTSIRAARRRLRYESWHLLHLYAYLGVGLALPHQLWTGQRVPLLARRHGVLVDAVGGRRRRRARLAAGPAAVAHPAARAAGDLGGHRGARRRVGLPDRATARPPATSSRASSSPGASSDGPGWTPRQPVLALGRPGRPQPADHRQGARRRQRRARGRCGPARARWSRARTAGSARGHGPAARSRSSAPASASPRCGRSPRGCDYAPGDAVLLHRFTRRAAVRRRVRGARPRARAAGRCTCPVVGAPPTPGSATGAGGGDDLRPRCALGPRPRRARRLRLRPRAVDRRRRAAPPPPPGSRPSSFHVETFGW